MGRGLCDESFSSPVAPGVLIGPDSPISLQVGCHWVSTVQKTPHAHRIARLKLLPIAVLALCVTTASSYAATRLYTATATGTAPVIANTATNGLVSLASSGPDVKHGLGDTVTAGTSVYVSATINLPVAQTTGDYFLHLSDGSSSLFFGRVYPKSATGGFTLAFASSSGTPAAAAYGTTVLSLNTSYNCSFATTTSWERPTILAHSG